MNDRDYIIALFDILGTEARQSGRPLSSIVPEFELFAELAQEDRDQLIIDGGVNPQLHADGTISSVCAIGSHHVEAEVFSDVNFLWCVFDLRRLELFCETCAEFFCKALHNRIPLRGGIAVGQAHMDRVKRVFVGKPLTEAERVEKAQLWVGVSFGPSFAGSPFNACLPRRHVLHFGDHRKPGHSDLIPGIVLDWPRKYRDMYGESPERALARLNTDQEHSRYYDLANAFVRHSANRKNPEG